MFNKAGECYRAEIENIKNNGLWKEERIITGPQGMRIKVPGRENVLNMCANNYLGLANHPEVYKLQRKRALMNGGYGLSSVRFICGTQEIHKRLER